MPVARQLIAIACLLALGLLAINAHAAPFPPADQVPAYAARVRVTAVGDAPVPADLTLKWTLKSGDAQAITSTGGAWSPWLQSTPEGIVAELGRYPNSYNRNWQLRTLIQITGHKPADGYLAIEVESRIGDGPSHVSPALLYGNTVGLLLWRDAAGAVQIDTLAGHGRRVYDTALRAAILPKTERPHRIDFGGRYIGGDTDLIAWREGIERLTGLGFNAMHPLPPPVVETVRQGGIARVWGAVYNPPGYAFNFAEDRAQIFADFAAKQAGGATKSGWEREDIAFWVTSDEPGWYYPDQYQKHNADPLAMADFHAYLRDQGLSPADLGHQDWGTVKLIGRRDFQPDDLPGHRLYYWSNRFLPWASSRFFAEVTRAYEAEIGDGIPIMVNFNNFMGRLYQPGPVGNNRAKTDPNAAMGQHDWMEFGRLRGSTCIATEDWFADNQAGQWSYYSARLRSAARYHDVNFGALVIPRTSGQRPDGMPQKILALVGHGAKSIKFFTFGPEYNFPGNCYSENLPVFAPLSRAMQLVARAEDLLAPGRPQRQSVAILTPQSAQLWDLQDQDVAKGLLDVTNTNPIARHMPYMTETFGLYTALQHSGIGADFVDELDLATPESLAHLRVIYVTAPDLPAESSAGLMQWVEAGGALVLTAGAARYDRYHQPHAPFDTLMRLTSEEPERAVFGPVASIRPSGSVRWAHGDAAYTTYGPLETAFTVRARAARVDGPDESAATVLASFDRNRGGDAVLRLAHGRGQIIRYAWYPGCSYILSADNLQTRDQLPTGMDDALRQQIAATAADALGIAGRPVIVHGGDPAAPTPLVEPAVLESDAGLAVTLLNWSGQDIADAQVRIRATKPVARVVAASSQTEIPANVDKTGILHLTLPTLPAVEILSVHYAAD